MGLIRFSPQAEHASRWWWQILFPELFLSFRSLKKKGLKRLTKRFYGCEKVAYISQFGCLHYFQNSVIVHKGKKQKLMFKECFYIDKDKAKLYVQCLDQNF